LEINNKRDALISALTPKIFYNFYIESFDLKREYKIVLDIDQINTVVNAYLEGKDQIMIKGTQVKLSNSKKFIIYSITDTSLGTNQAEIEKNIKNYIRTSGRKLSLVTFGKYGTNITDQFTRGLGWGEQKTEGVKTNNFTSKSGKIFISHSVKDTELVRRFTEDILILSLNLKSDVDIFNISIEDAGIKTSEDFKLRIENELKSAKAVIQIITENYKKSEACLNEMGAAWILNLKVIPFILEPISYNTVGFIHNTNQLLKINSKKDIKKFIAEYKEILFKSNYNDSLLDRKIEDFLLFLNTKYNKDLSFLNGKWINEHYVNDKKVTEPLEIDEGGIYSLINKEPCFKIVDFNYSSENNKIRFIKEDIKNPKRKILNELNVISSNVLSGFEDGKIKIEYHRNKN